MSMPPVKFPVFDGHNDLPYALRAYGYPLRGLDRAVAPETAARFQTDLTRAAAGGLRAQLWSAWVPCGLPAGAAIVATLEQIDAIKRLVAAYPDQLAPARTAADAVAAVEQGKLASFIALEGGHQIARSLPVLRQLAALGVRSMTLTHGSNTEWADSATDEPAAHGLTEEGVAIVHEMNRLGILVDLSHVTAETARAALRATRAPAIFTHSGAAAVVPHPRNVPDDVLGQLKANGGVLCLTFVPAFVSQARWDWEREAEARLTEQGVRPPSWADEWIPGSLATEEARLQEGDVFTAGPYVRAEVDDGAGPARRPSGPPQAVAPSPTGGRESGSPQGEQRTSGERTPGNDDGLAGGETPGIIGEAVRIKAAQFNGEWWRALAAYEVKHPSPAVTIDDVVRHAEHVREVAGIEHMGLGGDYDGSVDQTPGLDDVAGYPRLLDALAERGWSDDDLRRLTFGNTLRVLAAAERVAATLVA